MKAVATLATAAAAALLVAALVQAADLKRRLETLPPHSDPAAAEGAFNPAAPPPSPYELAEMAKRVQGLSARVDEKIAREKEELVEVLERAGLLVQVSGDTLVLLDHQSAAVKKAIGDAAHDKDKVAEMTKRIRTEQQKAMIRRFAGDALRRENEKLKAELQLTPEQAVQFDKVADEMMEKVADMGSSFMDGDMNMQGWQQLQKESNDRMATFLNEEQMTKYKDYQEKRFGGRRNQQQGDGQQGGGGQ